MRLLMYTDTFLPDVGGAETVLASLANKLVERGDTPVVLAPKPRRSVGPPMRFDYPVVRYRRPFSKRYGLRLILPRLISLHWRHRFDLVHCHAGYPQAYLAAELKRRLGVPYVVRPHGSDILPGERVRADPRLERRLIHGLNGAEAIIAQGDFLRDVILALGVDERKVVRIPNGVDACQFLSAIPAERERPYMLALGSLKLHKGFDILLNAYARLDSPYADLVIAGSGPERSRLQDLATSLSVADRVRFVGAVGGAEKRELYRGAEFFVCPSRREPFANVILEALAAGLPVIASAVGGNLELVGRSAHGLLYPAEDDSALASHLRRLLASASLRREMGQSAATFAAQYDWNAVVERYREVYRRAVEHGGTCGRDVA